MASKRVEPGAAKMRLGNYEPMLRALRRRLSREMLEGRMTQDEAHVALVRFWEERRRDRHTAKARS